MAKESPALLLCAALDAVEALRTAGYPVSVPHNTGSVVADGPMCDAIAKRLGLREETVREIFAGVPVKEARAVSQWASSLPEEERIGALRRWAEKRERRKAS